MKNAGTQERNLGENNSDSHLPIWFHFLPGQFRSSCCLVSCKGKNNVNQSKQTPWSYDIEMHLRASPLANSVPKLLIGSWCSVISSWNTNRHKFKSKQTTMDLSRHNNWYLCCFGATHWTTEKLLVGYFQFLFRFCIPDSLETEILIINQLRESVNRLISGWEQAGGRLLGVISVLYLY